MVTWPVTSLAQNPAYRQMTVEEFLELEIEGRAELEDGVLYMMAGGSLRHAEISANILIALGAKLRGSGCRPFGPDLAVRTGPTSLRLPDVSVYCDLPSDTEARRSKLVGDPRVVVEVLSPSTRKLDLEIKANEYRALPGVDAILFVDPETRRVRLLKRTGPEAWADAWLAEGCAVPLRTLEISLSSDEIFA